MYSSRSLGVLYTEVGSPIFVTGHLFSGVLRPPSQPSTTGALVTRVVHDPAGYRCSIQAASQPYGRQSLLAESVL